MKAARSIAIFLCVYLGSHTPLFAGEVRVASDLQIDTEQCSNCAQFPAAFLEVDRDELLDLEAMQPERRLDFLVGDWEIYFPADKPIGFDLIDWFVEETILHSFQEWPFANGGQTPWRANAYFKYDTASAQWQMYWIPSVAPSIFVGGLEKGGEVAFYKHVLSGKHRQANLDPAYSRYVFRNITDKQFLVESYDSADGGQSYSVLKWRGLYKKRTAP